MATHARGYDKPRAPKPKQRWRPRRTVVLDTARQFAIQRDENGRWQVVNGDGDVLADDFETNSQAWAWVDDHGDRAMEIVRDRVANAFRKW